MSDRATVLKINSVGAVGALSVIPAPLRHSCPPPSFLRRQESMRPPNGATSLPSARRPTGAPSAPRVIGRRRTLGAPLTPPPPHRSPGFLPPSVIPAEAGIHATAQRLRRAAHPPDRPTRAPSAARMIGRRRTLGARSTPTDRLDSCPPSVIPAEAGIHATAQRCVELPSRPDGPPEPPAQRA